MKARIATGLALASAVVGLTLWSPPWLFAVLALAILLAALVEWHRLMPAPAAALTLAAVAAALILAVVLLFVGAQKLPLVCLAGLMFWVWQAFDLAAKGRAAPAALTGLIQAGFILLFAWCALLWMRIEHGAATTIAMLLVVWSADVFAYFAGKRFGRHKLAPSISPGKTIEGAIGGLAGAGAVALLAASALGLSAAQTHMWLLASLCAALFGVVGDLYESRLKRRAGVKDSGAVLPGHGGVLDRVDGLVAATPVFATIWRLSG